MDLEYSLCMLVDKDTSRAFEALKELEKLSDVSDALYPHIHEFISMLDSDRYVMRVRGFRLFCKQAKWDTDRVIDRNLSLAMNILSDEKPTAVRQALAALHEVIRYKKDLREEIRRRLLETDCSQYKDTMHGLIAGDIGALLAAMDES